MSIRVLDLRNEQPNPPPGDHHQIVRGKVQMRDPAKVTGITVHQTACIFGPMAQPEVRYRRALNVAAHATAFNTRVVVLANPLRWNVWHGNGLNDSTLGLEIEGRFSGLLDNPATIEREDLRTAWGGIADPITPDIVETAREALRVLVELGRAEGMPLKYIYAHRQSSGTRRSDPGEGIWKEVVLEYACKVLGLQTKPALTMVSKKGGPGRTIPLDWQPDGGVGKY